MTVVTDLRIDFVQEAHGRWQRGDHLMALYYLDKAGFFGIEVMLRCAA